MSPRRRAVLLDVEPQADGSVLVVGEPGGLRHHVGAEALAERDALVAHAVHARQASPGTSFYAGDFDRDASAVRAELIWSTLRLWDLTTFAQPLLARMDLPAMVLYPGRSRLAHLSLRGSLREGLRAGALDAGIFGRARALAYWGARGLRRLLELCAAGAVPVVDPARTSLLVAPPPDRIAAMIRRVPRSRWEQVLGAALPDLRAARTTAAFEAELFTLAARLGVDVVHPATRAHLLDRIRAGGWGRSLFLIAHQDAEGIHLADGPLPLAAARAALADRAAAGAGAHDTVDLGVCGAEEEGNLADAFQAAGAPIVTTRGMTSYYGRDIVAALLVIRRLEEHGPAPLPDLTEGAWLDLHPGPTLAGGAPAPAPEAEADHP
jgi:hypothetical protein